jgi:hypothetical protein
VTSVMTPVATSDSKRSCVELETLQLTSAGALNSCHSRGSVTVMNTIISLRVPFNDGTFSYFKI